MTEAAQAPRKQRKGRSPNYPGIPLETAIERARTLYRHEQRNAAHVDAVLHHWGYKPKSGAGLVTLAALKKFGLVEDEGSGETRRARLSPLALGIILDEREDSPERRRAVKRAALLPPIHAELWKLYEGSLPSDESLRFTLRRDRGFTDSGADEFISEFRATIAFANLSGTDTMPSDGADIVEPREPVLAEPPIGTLSGIDGVTATYEESSVPQRDRPARPVQIPLFDDDDTVVTINATSALTLEKWDRMLAVLTALRPKPD